MSDIPSVIGNPSPRSDTIQLGEEYNNGGNSAMATTESDPAWWGADVLALLSDNHCQELARRVAGRIGDVACQRMPIAEAVQLLRAIAKVVKDSRPEGQGLRAWRELYCRSLVDLAKVLSIGAAQDEWLNGYIPYTEGDQGVVRDSSQSEEFASVYGKEAVSALEEALMLQEEIADVEEEESQSLSPRYQVRDMI